MATSTTPCSPFVSVPVLSKIAGIDRHASSRADRLRTRTPLRAASDVLIATTNGTASPNAWGQAITSTVATRWTTATLKPLTSVQTMAVRMAAARAT